MSLKYNPGELADRYTVLKLKLLHGLPVEREYARFRKATLSFDQNLLAELYDVNRRMWEVETVAERSPEAIVLGELFRKQRAYNKERVAIKNKISAQYKVAPETKSFN